MYKKILLTLLLTGLASSVEAVGVTGVPGAPGETANKCLAGKNKCVATLISGLMACRAQCEASPSKCGQKQTDCETKVRTKFDGGAKPEKGCFAKLEALQTVAKPESNCTTYLDSQSIETYTNHLVTSALAQLGDVYIPFGVQTNVPINKLQGWTECYKDTYENSSTSLTDIQTACNKSKLMLACRATDSTTLNVLAWAPRSDVLFDTGKGNTPHNANGVGWYYNNNWSWGFAPQGAAIFRDQCDTTTGLDDQRLCWHTNAGAGNIINYGYRCGANTSFNNSFERLIYQAD